MPDPSDHMFLGPISAPPLTSSVHAISCKEKALLEVSLPLSPKGKQTHVLWNIDSGSETNIIPTSLYNQLGPRVMNLQKPTMNLTAYGGTAIPNLGSCQVYIEVPNNPKPQVIHAQVVDVDGPPIIGNISAQGLNLFRLNWAVAIESNSKSTSQSPNPNPNYNPNPKPFFFFHTDKRIPPERVSRRLY